MLLALIAPALAGAPVDAPAPRPAADVPTSAPAEPWPPGVSALPPQQPPEHHEPLPGRGAVSGPWCLSHDAVGEGYVIADAAGPRAALAASRVRSLGYVEERAMEATAMGGEHLRVRVVASCGVEPGASLRLGGHAVLCSDLPVGAWLVSGDSPVTGVPPAAGAPAVPVADRAAGERLLAELCGGASIRR